MVKAIAQAYLFEYINTDFVALASKFTVKVVLSKCNSFFSPAPKQAVWCDAHNG